ncbi:MAG TPA: hypothetical protein EYQ03_06075 [Nitrospinaceae bacterium]|nr:hypothetical protein [Nitrospinaceae bacterium]
MKFKGTALMSAVFLSLVLFYFFVDLPAEQKEKIEKERAEKIACRSSRRQSHRRTKVKLILQ